MKHTLFFTALSFAFLLQSNSADAQGNPRLKGIKILNPTPCDNPSLKEIEAEIAGFTKKAHAFTPGSAVDPGASYKELYSYRSGSWNQKGLHGSTYCAERVNKIKAGAEIKKEISGSEAKISIESYGDKYLLVTEHLDYTGNETESQETTIYYYEKQ